MGVGGSLDVGLVRLVQGLALLASRSDPHRGKNESEREGAFH